MMYTNRALLLPCSKQDAVGVRSSATFEVFVVFQEASQVGDNYRLINSDCKPPDQT